MEKVPHNHKWSGWPEEERHPAYQSSSVPLVVSPDGALGYLKIHKCASNTHTLWLQNERGWGNVWPAGTRMHRLDTSPNRNASPSSILVLVRDPIERWLSAVATVGRFTYNPEVATAVNRYHADHDDLYTKNMNTHFWPYTWFMWNWRHFADRMEFRDIPDGWAWFDAHGVEGVPSTRHTNRAERKDDIREAVLTPDVEERIRRFYQHDYRLLAQEGIPHD